MIDDDVAFFRESLRHPDPAERVLALRQLIHFPHADPEVLASLDALLSDRTVWQLLLPPQFGEIRSLACRALGVARRAAGLTADRTVSDVAPILSVDELDQLVRSGPAHLSDQTEVRQFEELRRLGRISGVDVVL